MGLEHAVAAHTQEPGDRQQEGIVVANDDAPPLAGENGSLGRHLETLGPAETAGRGGGSFGVASVNLLQPQGIDRVWAGPGQETLGGRPPPGWAGSTAPGRRHRPGTRVRSAPRRRRSWRRCAPQAPVASLPDRRPGRSGCRGCRCRRRAPARDHIAGNERCRFPYRQTGGPRDDPLVTPRGVRWSAGAVGWLAMPGHGGERNRPRRHPFWGTRPRLRRQILDSDEAPEVLWLVRAYLITLHAPDAGGTRVYTEYHGTNQQVDSVNCRGPLAQVVRAADS